MTGTVHRTGGQGRRRPRLHGESRERRIEFAVTDDEFAVVQAQARQAGLSRGAYAAQAVLAAAYGPGTGTDAVLRELLGEFIKTSALIRRIGSNENQAVARLNATGQYSGELLACARACQRQAGKLDDIAEEIRQALGVSRRRAR